MVFAIHRHESITDTHVFPPSWTLPPTSLPTPSLWFVPEHQLWVPWFMHGTALVVYFTYTIYIFQCYYHKSSHPCLLPLSPKVWSLHLYLLCCPACRIVFCVCVYVYICIYIYVYIYIYIYKPCWSIICTPKISLILSVQVNLELCSYHCISVL